MKKKPYIIVIGNEKGGAGKTTTSMHLLISLLNFGFNVAFIDLDCRQKSLARYIDNRSNYKKLKNLDIAIPQHLAVEINDDYKIIDQHLNNNFDFILIDTPGSNTEISSYAHAKADTIITPINDSFLDLDVIAQIEADTLKIIKPSFYAEAIWQQKMLKAKEQRSEINWIVTRNRLSSVDAKNKQKMLDVLTRLSTRLGFKLIPGFNERVIYRELFLQGLTLLDIKPGITDINLNLSHIAAKQELNNFLHNLNIPALNQTFTSGT